jgi:serine/threonine protein kinase
MLGSYSKVKEAIDSTSLRRVAVKIIKNRMLKKASQMQMLKNEIAIMRRLKPHKNVLKFIETIHNDDNRKTYIVIENAGAGSVQKLMDSLSNNRLPMSDVWHFFIQMIEGLESVHNQGIVHHDIKPANMVLMSDGTVKLADFGTSCELDQFSAVSY